jgi:hypothetical protein
MPTAEEALAHIKKHNARTRRPNVPDVLLRGNTIKIFNIHDEAHVVSLGSLGTFLVKPCQPGQAYSEPLEIKPTYVDEYPVDMDMNGIKTAYNLVEGTDVAKEIVGTAPHKDASANLTKLGVFIAAGDEPTQPELLRAKAELTKHMQHLVAQGDKIAMQGPMEANNISDSHRKAAKFLNQKREWSVVSGQLDQCEACFESINPGSAVCRHCGAVLDDARAKKFKLGPYSNLNYSAPAETEATKPAKKS